MGNKFGFFMYGGGEGSRTPVRKLFPAAFYECSLLFDLSEGHTANKAAFKAAPIGPNRRRDAHRLSSPRNDVYKGARSALANGQLNKLSCAEFRVKGISISVYI